MIRTERDNLVAEAVLERQRIHPRRRALYRVEHVEPGLDEIREQVDPRAAAVHDVKEVHVLLHPVVDRFVKEFEQLAVGAGGNDLGTRPVRP